MRVYAVVFGDSELSGTKPQNSEMTWENTLIKLRSPLATYPRCSEPVLGSKGLVVFMFPSPEVGRHLQDVPHLHCTDSPKSF